MAYSVISFDYHLDLTNLLDLSFTEIYIEYNCISFHYKNPLCDIPFTLRVNIKNHLIWL